MTEPISWKVESVLPWQVPHPRAGRHVLRTQQELAELWFAHGGDRTKAPAVDFARYIVLCVFVDEGEYEQGPAVLRIEEHSGALEIHLGWSSRPWKVVNPAVAVKVAKFDGPCRFIEAPVPTKLDERRVLEEAIAGVLKPLGYRKQRSTWRRTGEETILVFNLQKSQWGPQFYLNVGVYLKALGPEAAPTEVDCHFRDRVSGLLDDPSPLEAALDFQSRLTPEQRSQTIREVLRSHAIPWLEARASEAKAREALLSQPDTGLVTLTARRHLGVEGPPR